MRLTYRTGMVQVNPWPDGEEQLLSMLIGRLDDEPELRDQAMKAALRTIGVTRASGVPTPETEET